MEENMLWMAVKDEDLYTARHLIKKGYDVNEECFGTSCLLRAIKTCNLDMVKLLLHSGATLDSTDNRGYGPLHIAIQISDDVKRLKIMKLLLESDALQNSSSDHGLTYIHEAVKRNDFDSIQLLLNAGAQLHCSNRSLEGAAGNPLHTAIKYLEGGVRFDMVKKLIRVGANVDSKDNRGSTCLHYAVEFGDPSEAWELIKLLLDAGAQINCMDENSVSPLAAAVGSENHRFIKKIINARAEVNISKLCTGSALLQAVKVRNKEIVKLLLDNGASVNVWDPDGKNILYYAVKYFNPNEELECISILKLLLMHGAKIHSSKYADYEPFSAVLTYGNTAVMNLFFENGISLDSCRVQSPLQHAVLNSNLEILEFLLKSRRYDVDGINVGWTALAVAVRFGSLSSVKLLIEWGADPNIPMVLDGNECSKRSASPLGQALCEGKSECIDLLFSGGATLDATTMRTFSIVGFEYKEQRAASLVGHVVLLKNQELPILPGTERFIKEYIRNYSKLIVCCQNEVERSKKSILYPSVTLYDILIGKDVTRYMCNQDFIHKFQSLKVAEQFPIYGNRMKYRFLLSLARNNLLGESKKNLKKILGKWKIRCESILYHIMKHLHVKDLLNICDVQF